MVDNDATEFLDTLDTNLKLFNKPEADREVKIAWWKLLKGFELSDIKTAFGKHALESKFAPKPADIVQALQDIHAMKVRAKREQSEFLERERVAALPAPPRKVDVCKELTTAQIEQNKKPSSDETKANTINRHVELIEEHKRKGFIRGHIRHDNGQCAIGGCFSSGTHTTSLRGSERWYCSKHWKAA